jgi:REP element-mobilizing transposase RayT
MKYNPVIHRRRSIRLKGFDYSSEGAYFVTLSVRGRQCLFGDVADGEMKLNDAGRMVLSIWSELPRYGSSIAVDEFVMMPNHVHGIVFLNNVGAGPRACPDSGTPTPTRRTNRSHKSGRPQGGAPTISLPDLVHRFKSLTTNRYRRGVIQSHWLPFAGKLWQRNYYEHIIRNENELTHVRQYIRDNPSNWETDEENPNRRSDS